MRVKVNFSIILLFIICNSCFCRDFRVISDRTMGADSIRTENSNHHRAKVENFILTDNLKDGELDRRISYSSITGKEISITHDSRRSLSLLQLSNGKEFLQLIYSDFNELLDCDIIRQKKIIHEFLQKFYHEIDLARSKNFTSSSYKSRRKSLISNHEFRQFLENEVIPEEYYDLNDDVPVNDVYGMQNLSYVRIDSLHDIPADMRQWLNFDELKIQCVAKHRQLKEMVKHMNSNDLSLKRNATEHLQRRKRALSDWLMAPNTKWCGRGHNASKYSHLGGASRADKCCRKHDHCRLNIPGLTTKWQLFNYRPFTLSYCKCDMRFRTCLKMADSADANMVGKLFFNIVQTKCFVLKPEKVCMQRSWWGKCEERVLRKRAHVRNNRQF